MQSQRRASTLRESGEGNIGPSTLAVALGFAIDVGRLIERSDDSFRCQYGAAGKVLVAVEPLCTLSFRYAVPPETIVNLLRLPEERSATGGRVLIFTYFQDECRSVRIVLAAEPLPRGLTSTPGGLAVVGLTGTRLHILATEEGELARVETFLVERLAPFAYEPNGDLP
jgi:hypothetical protein